MNETRAGDGKFTCAVCGKRRKRELLEETRLLCRDRLRIAANAGPSAGQLAASQLDRAKVRR